jgi:tRNA threonylcarbamoyladenosine biosynthesis protein TsaB
VKLLALDTATEVCSAALWLDGLISTREQIRPRGHGELILPMIEQLLQEAGVPLGELDAIAFGRGPGAFTGVRLAVSIAQGLGFSVGVPLIAISDLRAIAAQAMLQQPQGVDRVLVCQDARMEEVYWGCYQRSQYLCSAVADEAVSPPARVMLPSAWAGAPVWGAGSGFAAYPVGLSGCVGQLTEVFAHLRPRAREIAALAAMDGHTAAIAPEQAQPVYLRDTVAVVPNQEVTAPRSRN